MTWSRRSLLKVVALFSLIVFVTVCAGWVRSIYLLDGVCVRYLDNDATGERFGNYLLIGEGRLVWLSYKIKTYTLRGAGRKESLAARLPLPIDHYYHSLVRPRGRTILGFYSWRQVQTSLGEAPFIRMETQSIGIPLWSIAFVSLICPSLWLRGKLKASRRGLCRRCGYDLRASVSQCPECGETIVTMEQKRTEADFPEPREAEAV